MAAAVAALVPTLGARGSTAPGGNADLRRVAGAPLPAAVPPWSTVVERDLPAAAPTQEAGLAFGPDGASLLSWSPPEREKGVPSPRTRIALFGPRGEPGHTATIPRILAGPGTLDAARSIRVPTYRYASSAGGPYALGFSTAPPGPGEVSDVPLDLGFPVLGPHEFAVASNGDAAVVWTESTRPRDDASVKARLRVAFAPAGRDRFGAPTTLLSSDGELEPYDAVLAIGLGAGGRVAIAADSVPLQAEGTGGLLVWTGRPGALRAPLSIPTKAPRSIKTAITTTGRTIVAWGQQGGGEEASTGYKVTATSIAPGATRAGAVQTLDPGSLKAYPQGGLRLSTGPGGTAVLAWSGVSRTSYPARVATADAEGRFGPLQQLARFGRIGGLAIRDDGAAVVTVAPTGDHPAATVERDPNGAEGSVSFIRPAGSAPFGTVERLPIPPSGPGSLAPAPAFDPVSGRPSIAYVIAGPKGSKSAPARLVVVTRDRP